MARKSPAKERILMDLREKSTEYALKATQLSNLLQQAEEFLREMPGKVEVATPIDQLGHSLALERRGKEWSLVLLRWHDDEINESNIVTRSSIAVKANAARLLPSLYLILVDHVEAAHEDVAIALASLGDLPFLDFERAKQGVGFESFEEFEEREALEKQEGTFGSMNGGFPDDEIPF